MRALWRMLRVPWKMVVGREMAETGQTRPLPAPFVGVLAVDDQETFRVVLRRLVEAASGLSLLGEADSGELAVLAALELGPDMVLMDVGMPGIGGIAAALRIKTDRPATVIVLVSTTHPDDLPRGAAESADEIVWKPQLRPDVLESIWRSHGHRSDVQA